MKHLFIITISILFLFSCKKNENNQITNDTAQEYLIEGYLYSKESNEPIQYKQIALSKEFKVYSHSDPYTTTDSNGYFKIKYTHTKSGNGLNIYPVLADYSCVYKNISFISHLPSGENLFFKKILTKY